MEKVFRKQMAERLGRVMDLLEESVGRRASDEDLLALREAATLIVFRLMFLMELEGRGLLYLPDQRPRDRLSLFELADRDAAKQRKDSLLARLQEITEHIRNGTGGVALSGASIFANAPNDQFDPAVTDWLDEFDKKSRRANADLRDAWSEALAKVGALVTGQVEVYSKDAPVTSAVGLGGSEHVQRVLGDVYEQILAMVPKRERKGIVLTAGKAGEKNERKALAAHYTPEGMVVEMVRPLVGVLFRDAWTHSSGEPITYRKRLLDLHIVDPAMGSAHFLTVVAFEIAKELAWIDRFGSPQPENHFEVLENPDPWAQIRREDADGLQRSVRQFLPEVVRRCCYGVDVKPLACELGKLALWLFTMTAEPAERPALTFVDGNIRTGDSLLGLTWTQATEILRERLDWDPTRRDMLFGSRLGELRKVARELPQDDHLLRQRALQKLRNKMEEIRWVYDLALLAAWYVKTDALLDALRETCKEPRLLPRNTEKLAWDHLMMGEGLFRAKERDGARAAVAALARKHRVFHWDLEFPDVMDGRRFDGIVANPPFRGDRDLRGFIGEDGVAYLRDRFTKTDTVDYAGYFVLRYEQLLGKGGAFGTLGSNTLAQAKNRRIALAPLVAGSSAGGRFRIFRAMRSRSWPGEAKVHVCMVHMVPVAVEGQPRVVVPQYHDDELVSESVERVDRISSYLDDLPETALLEAPSMGEGLVYNGFFPRGDFDRPIAFLGEVPAKERAALRSYINNEDVQQSVQPCSTRVVIDFSDALAVEDVREAGATEQSTFLRKKFPFLLAEVERTVRRGREDLPPSARNKKAREYWWRHEEERPGLRRAWEGQDHIIAFGAVSKCWVPIRMARIDSDTGLEISPSHNLFLIPVGTAALHAVISSFVFEHHVRRYSGTLETRLSVAPTETFSTFPLPWGPTWSKERGRPVALPAPATYENLLAKPMEAIAALRQSILAGKDRSKIPERLQPGGPTDLYNLYDNPSVTLDVIARLRHLHVTLAEAVARAYGWHQDGPDGPALRLTWTFDRPWIDGTNRYVPDRAARREIIARLAKRNVQRFEEEMGLCLAHLTPLLPAQGLVESGIDKWRKDRGIGLSKAEVLATLEHGVARGIVKRGGEDGKRWWRTARPK